MIFEIFSILIIFLITVVLLFILYTTRHFNYWKNKGVPYLKPVPLFGSVKNVFTFKTHIGEYLKNAHLEANEPYLGLFVIDEPVLLIRDPELIKSILVKDFNNFNDHIMEGNAKDDPIGAHILFSLKNPLWKDMRQKLTPVFTTSKLKSMFTLMCHSGEDLVDYLKEKVEENSTLEVREICAKYTTDVISSTSFGIKANCFADEDAAFRQVSRRIFNFDIFERGFSMMCYLVAPAVVKLLHLRFLDKESSDFLRTAFWETMDSRKKSKVVREDLVDILLQMTKNENEENGLKLEDDVLVAQAVMFFMAGFETSSTLTAFALYEIAKNQDIQDRLREEVRNVFKKTGKFTYDSFKEMEYLDMIIHETLRKYPSLPFLDRRCVNDYKLPGTNLIIKKGTSIFISNMGLQYDPKYFPDPDRFVPERFTEENRKLLNPYTYLPFGAGPRVCIGARYGKITAQSAVAHVILNFQVDFCSDTEELKMQNKGFLLAPKKDIKLKFTKIM